MRQMILDRIQEIIHDSMSKDGRYISGGLQTIIKPAYGMNAGNRKACLAVGSYPSDHAFNEMNEGDLLYAFEHIVRCYYKSWG